jgi:hypothetical protein
MTTTRTTTPPASECSCRRRPGYWLEVSHRFTDEERDDARAYVRGWLRYHSRGLSRDRRFEKDPDEMKRKMWYSRLAEIAAGSILQQRVATLQTAGALERKPDLEGGVGVRWTSTGYLFLRSPVRYERPKWDPLDEPEIAAVGDETEIRLVGWTTQREIAPDYRRDGPYWSDRFETWAIPFDGLHLLPTPPADGRPIDAKHRRVA